MPWIELWVSFFLPLPFHDTLFLLSLPLPFFVLCVLPLPFFVLCVLPLPFFVLCVLQPSSWYWDGLPLFYSLAESPVFLSRDSHLTTSYVVQNMWRAFVLCRTGARAGAGERGKESGYKEAFPKRNLTKCKNLTLLNRACYFYNTLLNNNALLWYCRAGSQGYLGSSRKWFHVGPMKSNSRMIARSR